jgi:hypothetical protein
MAAAAPIMASKLAIPAIGAAAGAIFNKKNPLQGAMLGGIGGAALGPALGAIGGSTAAAGAAANAAPWATVADGFAAQEAGLGALGGMGWGGAGTGVQGAINATGGLLGSNPGQMMMKGGQMMMGQPQQQPMMTPPAPMPQVSQVTAPGSMASRGQGTALYRPRPTRFG